MRVVWILVVMLVLACGGYFLWKKMPTPEPNGRASARPTTAVVEARDISSVVQTAGDIGPADQVSVRPEVNGRIKELPVDIGDKVKKNDLLCQLDDKELQIERTQRVAEIDGARLQVEKAKRLFQRSQNLYKDKLVSLEQFEDAKTEYELSTNALERAVHALHLVEDRLSKTKIIAPFDCTVLTRPVSVGQAVSGSGGFNSGTEIMTIANLNEMIITAHINQADVIRLNTGQLVDVQVESVPGLRIAGLVERVAPQAVVKNGIKGFTARVQINEIDPRIRPGMTAILRIPVGEAINVLAVPLAAVYTDPQHGERYVFVKDGEKIDRRAVRIGLIDNFYAQVQEGLSEGEIVSLGEVLERPGMFAATERRRTNSAPAPTATTGSGAQPAPGSSPPAQSTSGGSRGSSSTATPAATTGAAAAGS